VEDVFLIEMISGKRVCDAIPQLISRTYGGSGYLQSFLFGFPGAGMAGKPYDFSIIKGFETKNAMSFPLGLDMIRGGSWALILWGYRMNSIVDRFGLCNPGKKKQQDKNKVHTKKRFLID